MCVVYWFSPLSLASGTQQFTTVPTELSENSFMAGFLIEGQFCFVWNRKLDPIFLAILSNNLKSYHNVDSIWLKLIVSEIWMIRKHLCISDPETDFEIGLESRV